MPIKAFLDLLGGGERVRAAVSDQGGYEVAGVLRGDWDAAKVQHPLDYYANLKDDVPMVEGDWTERHRMIQARLGEGETVGESLADEEADSLGLEGRERQSFIAVRVDELNDFEPGIVERRIRNELGEVTGTETTESSWLSRPGFRSARGLLSVLSHPVSDEWQTRVGSP